MRISDWSSDVCSSDLAWARGDVTALEELADDELKANPNVRKVLLTSRNARWADWIAERLDTPGTVFVADGGGHMAGHDSVQPILVIKKLYGDRVQQHGHHCFPVSPPVNRRTTFTAISRECGKADR